VSARNLAPVPADIELPDGPFETPVNRLGLTIPRLRVVPGDGEPYEVQVLNPDLLLFEDTAATHRWKTGPGTSPFTWLTFMAWAASRRTGIIDESMPWELFKATTKQIDNLSNDVADPTRPGPVPG
jgi:hypothetical protein